MILVFFYLAIVIYRYMLFQWAASNSTVPRQGANNSFSSEAPDWNPIAQKQLIHANIRPNLPSVNAKTLENRLELIQKALISQGLLFGCDYR